MSQFFQLAGGGASRYTTSAGNVYRPNAVTQIIQVPLPDPARDVSDLQAAGCRLLNADATQQYYRLVGGADSQYTASPSGHQYVTDDAGVTLVPTWLNADAQSLIGQGLTLNGVA